MQALAVLLGLFLVTFAGFAIFNDNPLGGEPIARVALPPGGAGGRKTCDAPPSAPEPGAKSAAKQAAPRRAEDRHHHRRLQRRAP